MVICCLLFGDESSFCESGLNEEHQLGKLYLMPTVQVLSCKTQPFAPEKAF
ncbi:hypothetical protein FHX05_004547 [Rhizobium sp. BK491]|nr:hypothetical protein [Rhizobium sp. BK491]